MYEMCVIPIMDYSATSIDLNACTKQTAQCAHSLVSTDPSQLVHTRGLRPL